VSAGTDDRRVGIGQDAFESQNVFWHGTLSYRRRPGSSCRYHASYSGNTSFSVFLVTPAPTVAIWSGIKSCCCCSHRRECQYRVCLSFAREPNRVERETSKQGSYIYFYRRVRVHTKGNNRNSMLDAVLDDDSNILRGMMRFALAVPIAFVNVRCECNVRKLRL
jgi:hypothetical protein